MRASTEFKNLEADWKQQVKYKRHITSVEKWNDFLDAYVTDIKFTDKPVSFYSGNFVSQLLKLLDFIADIDEGELKGFFEYILDDD